jgi:NAD(P)-dependent dehydrogenase (short-subunit alcohol dehydrogenase family)
MHDCSLPRSDNTNPQIFPFAKLLLIIHSEVVSKTDNMSHPGTTRAASSTNIHASGYRVLEGKIAIVTGASRGIGAAVCQNLAGKGCSLIMNYTSEKSSEKTEQLANQLRQEHGIQCLVVQADMGKENGPAHIVDIAKNNFAHPKTGKFQVDIVVNNAGVATKTSLEDCTASEFDWLYHVNVRGPMLLMKAVLPHLPHDRSGRVVNLSSVSSSLGFDGDAMYGGTKAALEAMTRTWARELAERATVNAVNPGPVATDMYAGTTKEFQGKMAGWTRNTPLAAIRPEMDRKDLVENAELAGGRPVSFPPVVVGVTFFFCFLPPLLP